MTRAELEPHLKCFNCGEKIYHECWPYDGCDLLHEETGQSECGEKL